MLFAILHSSRKINRHFHTISPFTQLVDHSYASHHLMITEEKKIFACPKVIANLDGLYLLSYLGFDVLFLLSNKCLAFFL